MQFIDLKAQYQRIQVQVNQRMQQVFDHGQFIRGPEISELETRLAQYTSSRYCIAVSSGTDALMMALMALGVGAGDEVITSPFSFIATASMVKLLGAKPIFVDIDPKTYNIDVAKIPQAITANTKAILPVNLYGQCANYDALNAIALQYGLPIIEDAAQSFGSLYKNRHSCQLGMISCTSFFPSKPLGCYGDGGACFTDDDALATKLIQIRDHGQDRRYHHVCLGINGRLDTLQAAILLPKLDIFDDELKARANIAQLYNALLAPHVCIPYIAAYNKSVYAQYTIRVKARDQLLKCLAAEHIPIAIHYPTPIHYQPLFASIADNSVANHFPHADLAAKQVLSLPFHPYMTVNEVKKISHLIVETLKSMHLYKDIEE